MTINHDRQSTYKHTHAHTNKHTNTHTHTHTHTNKQTNKQTNTHTHTHTHTYKSFEEFTENKHSKTTESYSEENLETRIENLCFPVPSLCLTEG